MNFSVHFSTTARNKRKEMLIVLYLLVFVAKETASINDTQTVQEFLAEFNRLGQILTFKSMQANWGFATNITVENQRIMLEEQLKWDRFRQEAAESALQFNTSLLSESEIRQFFRVLNIGLAAQYNETKLLRLSKVKSDMESLYSTAKVCLNTTGCIPLDPDLTRMMSESRDYDLLLSIWSQWRDASGKKMKSIYSEYVDLSNEAFRLMGYNDTGHTWRMSYESPTIEEDINGLFDQLRPLYEQLHAYARRKLKTMYGEDKFPTSGHIPAHILGNMWGQQWSGLVKELTPFPQKSLFDVTEEMIRQNYTALRIFETADIFFRSLGLLPAPEEFWNNSIFERPKDDREFVCHASAWDFYNGKDFRIKMCTVLSMRDLDTAHHEMGHIQYYLQYAHLPLTFRDGANPGFHEAVGDTMSLSVNTPEHMHAIGLLETLSGDTESEVNFLMSMALKKVAFLPFGYLVDQWRWRVFKGEITPEKYNEEWWNMVCQYQGIYPAVQRTSEDFDPGAKYHVPADVEYLRYFISSVLQFQFYKTLCDISGYQGPLHRCDIYNSKTAGKRFSEMLSLGSSKPWTQAMFLLTGQYKMDAQPMLEYFKPLMAFLQQENGHDIGWQSQCPTIQQPVSDSTGKK
ncbi:angiotensin-converting enzyme [Biomphalaria pfeifferi]|uniref:Angiotensin-converting enzyme n=1 Tax=Biomphalaria pfeifferi TaxID=112525 RepID=A0AAD8BPM4_BIOPF|nr:angiotensin-converting enzyme [Biomphalaria pfeifferi]